MKESTRKRIEKAFTYRAPKGDQVERYGMLRASAKNFALTIANVCPESEELNRAIVKVREAVAWANAAIACNEADEPPAA